MQSQLFNEIINLETEKVNPKFNDIDVYSTVKLLETINEEDQKVAIAVKKEIHNIALAVDYVSDAFLKGGRLFYVGSGTSGRLGIVDASECPPTFGVSPEMVQGIIAGGKDAIFKAQEGAEDKPEYGAKEIIDRNILPPDIVCGIAASGRTPFVLGALKEARNRNIITILISTNSIEQIKNLGVSADVIISPQVEAEFIAGSTRMKSGTAQKLVLNMISTASMVKIGKTFGNTMIDLQLTNKKLIERAKGIIMRLGNAEYNEAEELLKLTNGNVKKALFIKITNSNIETANIFLEQSKGILKKAIQNFQDSLL